MTLCTYWKSSQFEDHFCYDIRAKTRKDCKRKLEALSPEDRARFDKPEKVVIEYDGTKFDLIEQIFTEDIGSY